jgi:microcystin-dependent protein
MAPPYIGEIRMFAGNFAPAGWMFCEGQLQQIPAHSHPFLGNKSNGSQASPQNNVLATSTLVKLYAVETADAVMATSSISSVGGSQPHTNFQPYLCVNFIISLFGIFPSQT